MSIGIINIKADPRLGTRRVSNVMSEDLLDLRIGAQGLQSARLVNPNTFNYALRFENLLCVNIELDSGVSLDEMISAVISLITKRQEVGLNTILYTCQSQDLRSILPTDPINIRFITHFVVSENLHGAYVVNRSKKFAVGEVVNIRDIVDSMS